MFIEDDLIKFLKSSCLLNANCIYITDLNNVKCVCNKNFKKLNNAISKQLLQIILDIEISDGLKYFIINEKNKIIPIFENLSLNLDYNFEIILPIWFDDHIHGTLIFKSCTKNFNEENLKIAKKTEEFTIKYFIKQVDKNYRKGEKANE